MKRLGTPRDGFSHVNTFERDGMLDNRVQDLETVKAWVTGRKHNVNGHETKMDTAL